MKKMMSRWLVVLVFVMTFVGAGTLAIADQAPPSSGDEVITWVDENSHARAMAYENYSQFVVAQFAFDADRVTSRRENFRNMQRLLNRYERDLDRSLKQADRDVKGLVKDGKKALRRNHASGDGNRRMLSDIEDMRSNQMQAARAGALAAMYQIANTTTAQ